MNTRQRARAALFSILCLAATGAMLEPPRVARAGEAPVAANAATQAREIAVLKQLLASRYPEVQVTDIQPSPLPGIYAVYSPDAVVYADRTGEYVIAGPLIATRTKTDLSKEALDDHDSIKFDQLPIDKAIKTVRGTGERTVAVFADPDCPYCHNLEKELAGLTDVTIYTFLYPLTSLHPDARNKAHAIWCAEDRSGAWHDWMILDKPAPAATEDCKQDPIDAVMSLGSTLKIVSTPVIFLENGHRVSGTRTAAQLNGLLGRAHADKLQAATHGSDHVRS
jgi:thiol:disulfide interchange protein DsbC